MRFDGARRLAALASAELTYAQPGATQDLVLPAGYGHIHRDVSIGNGQGRFNKAVEGLLGWQMHRSVGLAVTASAARAATGVLVVMRAGCGPLSIVIPCRVVYTIDTANCQGFAYGTLPGHPETGDALTD